jgi:RNA recognition motif-containing protein
VTNWIARSGNSFAFGAEREDIIGAKLFVGNLNFQTTKDQLEALFAEAGELVDVFLPLDRNTGKPRGFAFVEYADEANAVAAVEKFNGHDLGGRALRVNEAAERPARPPRAPSFRGPSGGGNGGGDGGGFYGPSDRPSRPKGSRRNARGKKRSL